MQTNANCRSGLNLGGTKSAVRAKNKKVPQLCAIAAPRHYCFVQLLQRIIDLSKRTISWPSGLIPTGRQGHCIARTLFCKECSSPSKCTDSQKLDGMQGMLLKAGELGRYTKRGRAVARGPGTIQ